MSAPRAGTPAQGESRLAPETLAWIEEVVGDRARVVADRVLPGATSSAVHAIDVVAGGQRTDLVLRVFDRAKWVAEEPDVAEHEAAALDHARAARIETPELVGVDPTGERCGAPAVLMTRLAGHVDITPTDTTSYLEALAEALHTVHAVPLGDLPWTYESWVNLAALRVPERSPHPKRWERAFQLFHEPPTDEPPRFIHRDYHPTNVLWADGRITGIVDWVNACRGPAAADVAHCRCNLYVMYGIEAADRFLDIYTQRAPHAFTYHPWWEIEFLLDSLPDPSEYPPWRHWGLTVADAAERRSRAEVLLERALAQYE